MFKHNALSQKGVYDLINKNSINISLENFNKAVDFVTRTGPVSIGLIGGEPTLHPDFEEIFFRLLEKEKIRGDDL